MTRSFGQFFSKKRFNLISLFCVLILVLSMSTPISGEVVWEYTFDSDFPEDWRLSHGQVEIKDQILNATTTVCGEDNEFCTISMWKNSTAMTGTWSLDYFRSSTLNSDFFFYFVSEGVSPQLRGDAPGAWPLAAYCLFIYEQNLLQFGYRSGDNVGCGPNQWIVLGEGWHHIDITRNETGGMNLFINGEHLESAQSTKLDYSEHINLQIGQNDQLDNVTYSDTIDIEKEEPEIEEQKIEDPIEKEEPSGNDTNMNSLFFVGGILGTFMTIFALKTALKKKGISRRVKLGKEGKISKNNIHPPSKNDKISILALLGAIKEKFAKREVKPTAKLMEHSYLMHPIRLTTMQLLEKNHRLSSAEIRAELEVSWGAFGSHLKSLEEKGFVQISDEFDDEAKLVQTVYITESGRHNYLELVDLLLEVLETDNKLSSLDNNASIYDEDLYPQSDN